MIQMSAASLKIPTVQEIETAVAEPSVQELLEVHAEQMRPYVRQVADALKAMKMDERTVAVVLENNVPRHLQPLIERICRQSNWFVRFESSLSVFGWRLRNPRIWLSKDSFDLIPPERADSD
jgi:hypothetical protein